MEGFFCSVWTGAISLVTDNSIVIPVCVSVCVLTPCLLISKPPQRHSWFSVCLVTKVCPILNLVELPGCKTCRKGFLSVFSVRCNHAIQ